MIELVLLICVEITLCFLAILVFSVNPKNKTNQYFSLWVFFLIVWILSNYLENEPFFQNYRSLFLRTDFASAIFLGAFFYLFCLNFPQGSSLSWSKKTIIFTPSIILFILSFTDLIIKDIHFQDNTIVFKQSTLFLFYFLCFIFYVVRGCIELILKYKRSIGIERTQIFYVITGFSISAIMAVTLNLILPLFVFIPLDIGRLGIYGILIFCIFSTVAITKHHLFGIKVILTETLVAAIALILLSQAISAETIQLKIFGFFLFSLFGVAGYFLIRSVIREIELRAELEVAYAKLKELDDAKSEFISIASHQLRTPLTAVKGYISMILENSYGEVPGEMKRPIENIYASNERLIRLVNDILNISKIEAGRIEMSLEKASLKDLILDVINELKIKADVKKLYLKFEEPSAPMPDISFDKMKIRQIIMNLIDNAIKYTPQGGITVRLRHTQSNLRVEIQDTGIGLEKEDIAKLFRTFSRTRAGVRASVEGAGLGLYIARKFMDMHGGQIWVESPGKDKGSTFFIELPIK
jgi:signal transduction histidine kinase